ncbi:MAG: serine protease [Bacteroidota bacterium]
MKYLTSTLLLAFCLVASPLQGQFIQDSYITGIGDKYANEALVKIVATVDNRQKNATGFCWQDSTHIVTALHAVAGSRTIVIKSPNGQSKATIEKVFRKGDLALLKLDPNRPLRGLKPLKTEFEDPNYNRPSIWGFPLRQEFSGGEKLEFKVTSRPIKLKELIIGNDGILRSLDVQGYPHTDVVIFNVISTIHPGHSGAPILNERGQLIAIADGGLRRGTAGINWAIPANYLSELKDSDEAVDAEATNLDVLHCVAGEGKNLGHLDTTRNDSFIFGTHLNHLTIGDAIETLPEAQAQSLLNAAAQFYDRETAEGRVGYNELMRADINVYLDERSGIYFATPSPYWRDSSMAYAIHYRQDPHPDIPEEQKTQLYCQTAGGALGFTMHMEKADSYEASSDLAKQFIDSRKYTYDRTRDEGDKAYHDYFQLSAEQSKEEYSLEIYSGANTTLETSHMIMSIVSGPRVLVADLQLTNNVERFERMGLEEKDFIMLLFCMQITGLSMGDM